jgi:hypothetical protein
MQALDLRQALARPALLMLVRMVKLLYFQLRVGEKNFYAALNILRHCGALGLRGYLI